MSAILPETDLRVCQYARDWSACLPVRQRLARVSDSCYLRTRSSFMARLQMGWLVPHIVHRFDPSPF